MCSTRGEILAQLSALVGAVEAAPPVRVAIDGVDASGKTVLADELSFLIAAQARPVIRASVDGFHNPKQLRYQRGEDSPAGYYRDSFDHTAILQELLLPLGPGGNRQYRPAVFDYRTDTPLIEPVCEAPADAILLFDGVFLLRPELASYWDFAIFLAVDFDISVPRAVLRDIASSRGQLSPQQALTMYNRRYVPGQKIYLAEAKPHEKAQISLDNNDFANPKLIVP